MRTNILFMLSLLAVAFMSCDKAEFDSIIPESSVSARVPQNKPFVKTETGNDYAGTFTYNNKGQIVEELYTLANGDMHQITYTYLPNLVEMKEFDSTGTLLQLTTMKLNNKGLVIELKQSGIPRTSYYQYDNKDRVIKEYSINDDGSMGNTFFYFWNSAGDQVKDSLSKPDGYWGVYNNAFYTNIPNTIAHENYGKNFFGKQSKHYMQRRVMTSSESELHVFDFLSPVQDAQDRLIDRTVVTTNYTDNLSYTATYQYSYY